MPTIFDISEDIRAILDRTADGELTDEQMAELDSLQLSMESKAEQYKWVIKELESGIAARDAVVDQLKKANQCTENDIGRIKKNLLDAMTTAGVPKIKTPLVSVWTQTTQRVDVTSNPIDLPPLLQRVRTIIEADKEAIKLYAEKGNPMPEGVSIVETVGLRIR